MPSLGRLAALVLFADYTHNLEAAGSSRFFSLSDPAVIRPVIGAGALPVRRHGLEAVGRAAARVVNEVPAPVARSRESGGHGKPDYSRAVDLLTRAAIRG